MIDKRLFLTVLIIVLFIFVSFGVYGGTITTIYNFSGITNPSSTHIAYNSSLISNLPWNRVKNLTYSEFTNGCYSNISNNDNKNCTTKAIGSPTGTKPIQFFNFTINTPTAFSDIQQLNISWKGEGVLKQPTPLPSATIYFWNWTKNNWSIMGGSAILGYKQVNRSFTTNINNIINQSNYDVWVLVQGNTSSILYNSQITTDYIELKVNSQTLPNTTLDGTTITLCGKVGNYSSINMKNGAIINVCEYDGTVNTGILTLENLTSFYMCPTCKINADYTGYRGTTTTGEGKGGGIKATTCGFGGGGGGYGAAGGNGDQGAGGSAYGNSTNVTSMGSAGGGNSCNSDKGGDGGGYVKINVSSTSTIDGIITSNGENGGFEYAGGAAGGGLWLITSTLQGSGTIRANGGAYGGTYAGGGAGGRILIWYRTNTSLISTSVLGKLGYQYGRNGTIYYRKLNSPPTTPISIYPTNGTAVGINSTFLNATSSDTDNDNIRYGFFIGTSQATMTYNKSVNTTPSKTQGGVNVSGLKYGSTYYWKVIATDSNNSKNSSFSQINQFIFIRPAVSQKYPSDNSFTNRLNLQFNFTVDDILNINSCSLYGNWTTWRKITNLTSVSRIAIHNFSYQTFSTNKTYQWNVWCNN